MNILPKGMILDIPATLHLDSWAGRRTYRIQVIGETSEYYKFKALEKIPMPRGKWIESGEMGRAPKHAVTTNTQKPAHE